MMRGVEFASLSPGDLTGRTTRRTSWTRSPPNGIHAMPFTLSAVEHGVLRGLVNKEYRDGQPRAAAKHEAP